MKIMLMLLFSMILVDNLVLSKFLGICSFLGLTKDLKSSMGMSMAVTFVMLVATGLTWPVYTYVLEPWELGYLDNLVFILVIASTVQVIEAVLRKAMPQLYEAMGIFLPLITTNCAILGVMFINIGEGYSFLESMSASCGAGLGYGVAMYLFAGVRQRLEDSDPPAFLRGMPITLISASIVSVSFMGFKGIVENLFS